MPVPRDNVALHLTLRLGGILLNMTSFLPFSLFDAKVVDVVMAL